MFSIAKCKQLFDQDLTEALKALTKLEELDLSYTNISGKCFVALRDPRNLSSLRMNCCPKLKDDTLHVVLTQCQYLRRLDVSATSVTGAPFQRLVLTMMRRLYLDFCPR